jgi:hypothetical protein
VAGAAARLGHVYWIGGGSGAGKSVIARRVAARHGLRRYPTDDVMADHGRRCAPADSPYLTEFAAMDMDERWVNRSPAGRVRPPGVVVADRGPDQRFGAGPG